MRVIAVESFTDKSGEFHPYGHEFEMAEGKEFSDLEAKGIVRKDDRNKASQPPAKKSRGAADSQ